MDTAAQVLLIIVSATLTLFLLVLIIAFVYTIKILKQIRRITERAENVAGSVEAAAETFEKTASPLAVLKIVAGIVENVAKFSRRKG
jgi:sensor histidine kinase YesM